MDWVELYVKDVLCHRIYDVARNRYFDNGR